MATPKSRPHVFNIGRKSSQRRGDEILKSMLCDSRYEKYALKMDGVAASLHVDHDMRITRGVDCLSIALTYSRDSVDAVVNLFGFVKQGYESIIVRGDERQKANVFLQACLMYRAATLPENARRWKSVARIDTTEFKTKTLDVLSKVYRDAERLRVAKPTFSRNDVSPVFKHKAGSNQLQITNTRYKTKMMESAATQTVLVCDGGKRVRGRAVATKGKGTTLQFTGKAPTSLSKNAEFFTIGRDAPTTAECQREQIVLEALQCRNTIIVNYFVQAIWQPFGSPSSPPSGPKVTPFSVSAFSTLNPSQKTAVSHILSKEPAITIVQGPPGTGKTTVIATASMEIVGDCKKTVWIVTQSNVATKNVAEAFAKRQFFEFKLLVSEKFHFEWHEHIYSKQLDDNLIRSDEFTKTALEAERQLKGSRVILCTLSMLSNTGIQPFATVVPVQTIIVDEASQIEVGGYLPAIHLYQSTLCKMVFIGDDKQLPPYGQEENPTLKSIFEFPHLRERALFLDIQYRMPTVVGDFISRHIYNGKLKTVHAIHDRAACRLVDVKRSIELKVGTSWANVREVDEMVKLVRSYVSQKKSSFKVITPYDPQRNRLEEALKKANLPWEGVCFCVDSFQGNEADHIILSLVKTEKLGFLTNLRRMNVALTRCKQSMVLLTNRRFVEGVAAETLVGKLAAEMGSKIWI